MKLTKFKEKKEKKNTLHCISNAITKKKKTKYYMKKTRIISRFQVIFKSHNLLIRRNKITQHLLNYVLLYHLMMIPK